MSDPYRTQMMAFLAGEAGARNELPRDLQDDLVRMARRLLIWDDRPGEIEAVISRTWESLLRHGPSSFDPDRGSTLGFVYGHMRNAARDARKERASGPEFIPSDDGSVCQGTERRYMRQSGPIADTESDRTCLRLDVDAAVSRAVPMVRAIVAGIREQGLSMAEVGRTLGLPGYRVKRMLVAWAVENRLAA